MDLKFRVAARIARPVHEVFEAVADPQKLSNYFTTGGAQGRLETGATVIWDFRDFPGAFPVEVIEVVPNEKIVLKWEASDGEPPNLSDSEGKVREAKYQTTVTMTFTPIDDDTPYGPWGGLGIMGLWVLAALLGGYVLLKKRDA